MCVQGLTTGVDDTEVLPCSSVTRISEVSGWGSNQTAFLSLTARGENLQSHRRLAVWRKQRQGGRKYYTIRKRPERWNFILHQSIQLNHLKENDGWFICSLVTLYFMFAEISLPRKGIITVAWLISLEGFWKRFINWYRLRDRWRELKRLADKTRKYSTKRFLANLLADLSHFFKPKC